MSMPDETRPRRTINWAPVVFLVLFLALVALVANYWVVPMLRTVHGDPAARQRAALYGTLVLVLLLSLLVIGLMASFRLSAWLFGPDTKAKSTPYIDIWKEAGRRVAPPTSEELEEPDSDKPPSSEP